MDFATSFILQIKMKLGIRPHVKFTKKDEEIQPWSAEESTMLHLIIQSGEMQIKPLKNAANHLYEQQAYSPNVPNKQRHLCNFNNNLRKYEKMKADSFQSKKQVNFIEKNIKGVSQDFMFLEENSPNLLMNKLVREKQRKDRSIEQDLTLSIEPVNWSLIMWYEEDKSLKKHRHKDIQSFLRTQSRSAGKRFIRKESEEDEDSNKNQAEKYQKLLKLREGLRKRNLKSASESRKVIEGSLVIEDNYRTIITDKASNKLRLSDNAVARGIPKTSSSSRDKAKVIKIQRKNLSPQHSQKIQEKSSPIFLYTSHRNRLQPKKVGLEYRSRVK